MSTDVPMRSSTPPMTYSASSGSSSASERESSVNYLRSLQQTEDLLRPGRSQLMPWVMDTVYE